MCRYCRIAFVLPSKSREPLLTASRERAIWSAPQLNLNQIEVYEVDELYLTQAPSYS